MSDIQWIRSNPFAVITNVAANASLGARTFEFTNDMPWRAINLQIVYTRNVGAAGTAIRVTPKGRIDLTFDYGDCPIGQDDGNVWKLVDRPAERDVAASANINTELKILSFQYLSFVFEVTGGNANDIISVRGVYTT